MSKMSELDMDRQILDAISEAMKEPELTAELQIERRVDFLVRELDEFCRMATNAETMDLIENQKIAFGQMQTRCQLILSFLLARKPTALRIVSNG